MRFISFLTRVVGSYLWRNQQAYRMEFFKVAFVLAAVVASVVGVPQGQGPKEMPRYYDQDLGINYADIYNVPSSTSTTSAPEPQPQPPRPLDLQDALTASILSLGYIGGASNSTKGQLALLGEFYTGFLDAGRLFEDHHFLVRQNIDGVIERINKIGAPRLVKDRTEAVISEIYAEVQDLTIRMFAVAEPMPKLWRDVLSSIFINYRSRVMDSKAEFEFKLLGI